MLTPVMAYLKIANDSDHSFLLESVIGGENLARYSFVGAGKLRALHSSGIMLTGEMTLRPAQGHSHRTRFRRHRRPIESSGS